MNELKRHKKSDKIKWIITAVCFVLLFAFMAGLCMQLFAKDDKYKPSEWLKKFDTEQTQPDTDENKTPEMAALSATFPRLKSKTLTAMSDNENGITAQADSIITNPPEFNSRYPDTCEEITFPVRFCISGSMGSVVTTITSSSSVFYGCRRDGNRNLGLLVDVSELKALIPSSFIPDYAVYDCVSIFYEENNATYYSEYEVVGRDYFHIPVPDVSPTFFICVNYIDDRTPVQLPADPVKEGHTFVGWYYDSAFTRPYDGEPIYADTALYAKFEINRYTVTFNSDGGSSVASQVVNWNTAATLTTPTRDRYAFKGWFLSNGTQYTNQAITADTTLIARWERNLFTVTFNSSGGSEVDNQDVTLNKTVSLSVPIKNGYDFKGWFMSDGKQYTNQPVTSDLELTAHWEIKMCVVTFYVGGEVYTTKTVAYGTPLVSVIESANELNLCVMSVRSANGNIESSDFANMTITDDSVEFVTEELTGTDKVINTLKTNKWQIIGGVAGGVALIAVIAAIAGGVKRKKR